MRKSGHLALDDNVRFSSMAKLGQLATGMYLMEQQHTRCIQRRLWHRSCIRYIYKYIHGKRRAHASLIKTDGQFVVAWHVPPQLSVNVRLSCVIVVYNHN